MERLILLLFLISIVFLSCKKKQEIIKDSVTYENDSLRGYDNILQKDLERTINDSMVKVVKINDKIVTKQEALNVKIINVSSTVFIRNKENDNIEFKINLSK